MGFAVGEAKEALSLQKSKDHGIEVLSLMYIFPPSLSIFDAW